MSATWRIRLALIAAGNIAMIKAPNTGIQIKALSIDQLKIKRFEF